MIWCCLALAQIPPQCVVLFSRLDCFQDPFDASFRRIFFFAIINYILYPAFSGVGTTLFFCLHALISVFTTCVIQLSGASPPGPVAMAQLALDDPMQRL